MYAGRVYRVVNIKKSGRCRLGYATAVVVEYSGFFVYLKTFTKIQINPPIVMAHPIILMIIRSLPRPLMSLSPVPGGRFALQLCRMVFLL